MYNFAIVMVLAKQIFYYPLFIIYIIHILYNIYNIIYINLFKTFIRVYSEK